MCDHGTDAGSISGLIGNDPDRTVREANRAGIATAGLTPRECSTQMADRVIELTVAMSQATIRGEELEAENQELRKQLRELRGE